MDRNRHTVSCRPRWHVVFLGDMQVHSIREAFLGAADFFSGRSDLDFDPWPIRHADATANFHNGGTDPNNDVVLGTGQMDWPKILKAAKKSGVKHYFIEDESASAPEQIPQTLKFLETVKF